MAEISIIGNELEYIQWPFVGYYKVRDIEDILRLHFHEETKPYYIHREIALESMRWELGTFFTDIINDCIEYYNLKPTKIKQVL
jgi:hypothetical protein